MGQTQDLPLLKEIRPTFNYSLREVEPHAALFLLDFQHGPSRKFG